MSGKDIYGPNMSKGPNIVVHIDNIHYLVMKSEKLTKHRLIGSSIGAKGQWRQKLCSKGRCFTLERSDSNTYGNHEKYCPVKVGGGP